MKEKPLLLAFVLCAALGCDSLPGRPDPADRYQRPSEVEDFALLYATHCSGCHGADGRNGPATNLGDPLYAALADPVEVRRVIAEGVAGTPMPVFARTGGGTLTEKQVNILAEGLKAGLNRSESASRLRGAPPLRAKAGLRGQASTAQLARGEQAYATHCARCHGAEGTGGASGGSLLEPAFLGLVSDQGLRTAVIVGRVDLGMPGWQAAGERPMTAAEVSDVVAWLGSHRASPGDAVPGASIK